MLNQLFLAFSGITSTSQPNLKKCISFYSVAACVQKTTMKAEVGIPVNDVVDTLLDFGVRKEAIPQVLVQFPDILGMKVMDKVQTKLPWLMG